MPGPLDGLVIADFTQLAQGPFSMQIMGDMGAEIIKIEPLKGDWMRHWSMANLYKNGEGVSYLSFNRNKRSIALDLRRGEALDALLELIKQADVLLFNLRPASMGRLGLGYEALSALNPRLIYCGCYGFGENGPYAGKPALDDLIQGAVSLPSLVQRVIGEPRYLPTNICDRTTGITTVYSITAALYAREKSGKGQAIEVPMFETMTQFVTPAMCACSPRTDAPARPRTAISAC